MLDFSFSELAVVGTIALVVLGPERLPEAARTAGRWVGKARRFTSQLQHELTSQLNTEELRKEFTEHQQMLDQQMQETRQALLRVQQDARSALTFNDTAQDSRAEVRSAPAFETPKGMLSPAGDPPAPFATPQPVSLTAGNTPRPIIAAAALQPSCSSAGGDAHKTTTPFDATLRNADEQ